MDHFKKNTQNNNRRIDQLADEVIPWWQKNYRTVGKREVATWKATLVIMFIAGVAATLIWSTKNDFNDFSNAAANATLFFSPASGSIAVNEDIELVANINPGLNAVSAVELHVTFDATKFSLTSITPSVTFSDILAPASINNTLGTGSIVVAVPSANPNATANPTAVATFSFHALAIATNSAISFANTSVAAGTTDGVAEPGDVITTRTGATVTVTAAADTTPPIVTLISPIVSQVLPAGTTTTNLSVITNETAICKYATTDSTFVSMPDENVSAPGTSHSFALTGLANSTSYNYYVSCQDLTPNTTLTNVHASFSVDAAGVDNAAPTITVVDSVSASLTKSDTINVTVVDASGVASQFYGFSTDSTCNASDTIGTAFASGTNFAIAGDHADYLCVKATDSAVGSNVGYQLVGQLHTDNTAPVGGTFSINGGANEIVSTSATLNVTCPTDAWETVQMAYGNSANPTNWTNCSSTASLTLGSGNGTKTVYMRFRDGGQNTSSDVTDTITLNISATPVNGACGSSNGTTVATVPSTNFCAAGSASSVTGAGPWTWLCAGSNGGSSASCSANKTAAVAVVVTPPTTSSSNNNNKHSSSKKKSTPARTITNSKKTIKFGQTLIQRGKKFSKNSFVLLYFSKVGGGYYAPQKVKTSSTGSFSLTYRANKSKGKYSWYAVDVATGKKSKVTYYIIK